jgi:hypothetical protein
MPPSTLVALEILHIAFVLFCGRAGFKGSENEIVGSYYSAPFQEGETPKPRVTDGFTVDLAARTVR